MSSDNRTYQGLVKERHNSSLLAMALCLCFTNPSTYLMIDVTIQMWWRCFSPNPSSLWLISAEHSHGSESHNVIYIGTGCRWMLTAPINYGGFPHSFNHFIMHVIHFHNFDHHHPHPSWKKMCILQKKDYSLCLKQSCFVKQNTIQVLLY